MGELESSIFVIGSPDLDLMNPKYLPKSKQLKNITKYHSIDSQ